MGVLASLPDALQVGINSWGIHLQDLCVRLDEGRCQPDRHVRDDNDVQIGTGYWTRANTEPCLLATWGKPKRLNADVRMAIISPRRQHSRKPDDIHARIERLVAGPYLELFARRTRPGWTTWGDEVPPVPVVNNLAIPDFLRRAPEAAAS